MQQISVSNERKKVVIDLEAYFAKIKAYWYVCIIGILVGALLGVLYYGVISTPKYESTSLVYLRSNNKKLSFDSLQLTTSLTQDYQIIFTSRKNLHQVKKNLNLKYSIDELRNLITIENPQETRILEIHVKTPSAKLSKKIADALTDAGINDIREIDSQEPYVIDKANLNTKRVGLSLGQMTASCALFGLFIVLLGIFTRTLINNTFTSADDAEKTLDLPVLAIIAEDESLAYAKLESSNSRRRKHHGKKTSK